MSSPTLYPVCKLVDGSTAALVPIGEALNDSKMTPEERARMIESLALGTAYPNNFTLETNPIQLFREDIDGKVVFALILPGDTMVGLPLEERLKHAIGQHPAVIHGTFRAV